MELRPAEPVAWWADVARTPVGAAHAEVRLADVLASGDLDATAGAVLSGSGHRLTRR